MGPVIYIPQNCGYFYRHLIGIQGYTGEIVYNKKEYNLAILFLQI